MTADDADVVLRLRDVSVDYRTGRRSVRAVDGVSLDVARGTTVGVVGESGSGKTTLGNTVLGLVPVSGGSVEFDGQDITRTSRADRRELARRMQVVFQNPFGSMNPARTVGETVGETLHYNLGLPDAEVRRRVVAALDEVGLPASAADRYPSSFSGGQRQRIAIARAITMDPELLVCDEPVSALDLSVQAQVLNVLARLVVERSMTSLFISHDLSVIRYVSTTVAVMFAGRVVEQGPAAEVADRPRHPYTRALLAAAPVPDPVEQARRREERRRLHGVTAARAATTGCAFAPRCAFAVDRCRIERPELAPHGEVSVACHRTDVVDAEFAALTATATASVSVSSSDRSTP